MSGQGRRAIRLICCIVLLGLGCTDAQRPRDVLLITVDTLRADYVHAYGFAQATTPEMDALAARGARFGWAIAAATVTAPAHASIMTSRYAREHSIGTLNGETKLAGGRTLAEAFAAAGYSTGAFVSNIVLRRRSGLDRGFAVYDDELEQGEQNRKAYYERAAELTVSNAIEWLASQAGAPVFLWVHLQDPHGPYAPPEAFAGTVGEVPLRMKNQLPVLDANFGRAGIPDYQRLGDLRDPEAYAGRYAEEIMYADHELGRLVDAFEGRRQAAAPLILLTSDHGESLGESGFFFQHGHATTPELARVPFIVVADEVAHAEIDTPVSHVDIAPTLLELAGLAPLPDSSGVSLVPLIISQRALASRPIFCDTDGEAAVYNDDRYTRVAGGRTSARPSKIVEPLRFESQRRNAHGQWRAAALDESARDVLERYVLNRAPLVAADRMDKAQVEQLRSLGYLPPAEDEPEQGRDR
jgi:arylsulfatase A-like enzyme